MGLICGGVSRRYWLELALVLAVFAAGTGLGMARFKTDRSPEGRSSISCPTTFLAQPLMMAAGRGSFHPVIESVPGLLAFLEHTTATFDPDTLPARIPAVEDSAAEYHRYLGWTVATIWRVFGISWRVLEPLMAIALGLCAACAYGLFRLGMNRWLSLAGTALFVSSPAVLDQVNNMRDFSKAPFLLGGLFAIGWLVTRRAPPRFLWLSVALMGVLAGVGMGFRQDAIILVPASLAVLLALAPRESLGAFRRRAGAALLYLLAFLAAAAPMLTRMEGSAQPYHPLAQGFSMKHLDRCALVPGVCEPLANGHDNFVFATIFSYARRVTGNDRLYFGYSDPEDAQFTRDWVIRTALQSPADTIARGYGATLNLLAGADTFEASLSYHSGFSAMLTDGHRRIAAFFRVAGPPIAVLALLAAAAAGIRPGLALLLLALYFCGYVSLDNEWRHTFHLSFVCFWAAGFLLQQLSSAFRQSLRGTAQWGLWLRRAAVFLVLGSLALWAPWQAARLWQHRTLDGVLRQYAAAPRAEVPTRAESMRDWTLFRMGRGPSIAAGFAGLAKIPILGELLGGSQEPQYWEASCQLYAACFRARRAGHVFMAKYRGEGSATEFSQLMRVSGAREDGGETWFFFPAYDIADRTRFEGVALPGENAGDFLGLYRVEDHAGAALLPCVTLNEPDASRRLTARLEQPYDPMRMFTPENDWLGMVLSSQNAGKLGRTEIALLYARAANALKPSSELMGAIALVFEQAGETQESLRLRKSKVLSSGGDLESCVALEDFLKRNAAEVPAPPVWEELARQTPSRHVWWAYERSLDEKDAEWRMHALRQLLRIAPDDLVSAATLQGLLISKAALLEAAGDLPGAITAHCEAIPLNPLNNGPVLRLDELLAKGSPAARRSVWETVWKENPGNAHVATLCGTARAATGDTAAAKEAFDSARRLAPEQWYYLVLAADALATAGAWDDAVAAYGNALALNPKLDYVYGRLDEAKAHAAEAARPPDAVAPPPAAP
jgi:tetratricopeptide (TPR) repeat protein